MKTNKELCIKMWEIVADEGVTKHRAFLIIHNKYPGIKIPLLTCFACEEADERRRKENDYYDMCNYCPVTWNVNHGKCFSENSPFEDYLTYVEREEGPPDEYDKEILQDLGKKVLETIERTWKD